ncbi:MAG: RNA polymerase sigma factor [Leptospirillia bacterium]
MALAERASGGDAEAFESLIAPYLKRAYGYAMRLCGDPHLSEDLCQDAFIKAFRKVDSFAGNSAFSTWLFRILHTTFLDHVKRRRVAEAPLGDDGEPPEAAVDAVARFQEQTRKTEREEWLAEGIARLPPEFATMVVLRDIQGFSYREIADITGEPVGTVKSRLARGRERLRQILVTSMDQSLKAVGHSG